MKINHSSAMPAIHEFQRERVMDDSTKQVMERKHPAEPLNIPDIQKKIKSINQFMNNSNTHLKFSLHEELNEYYAAIVDEQTNVVVKEIPPKKLLDMFASMKETIGLFIDKKI